MEFFGEKNASRFSCIPDIVRRVSLITESNYFVVVLIFWLLLLFCTCKFQLKCHQRRQQIVHIKTLQLKIRKKLKREQLLMDLVKGILREGMVQIEPSGTNKIAELTDLCSLLNDINKQLGSLESLI